MKPLRSIYDGPSKSREFLAGFVGTILILAIIFGVPMIAVLISLSGFIPTTEPAFCLIPLTFIFGGIQLFYRLVKSKRSWALLGVGMGLLVALMVGFFASFLFHIYLSEKQAH